MTLRRAVALVALLVACTAVSAAPVATRIVSLIPSLTEGLFAIGAGAQVVGVSQYTDYPPVAARLPQVSSFSSVDAEAIVRLHPDLIVGIPSQRNLVADLRRLGLRIELVNDDGYDDIFRDLRRLGDLSGRRPAAEALIARLRLQTATLVRTVPRTSRPRVLVVLGVSPVFTVGPGSYIARLLELAGARNAAGDLHGAYGRYSAEAVVTADPDVVIADRASGLTGVLDRPPWNALRAVRARRVYVLDDAALLERPGPRYNEGLRWLIARLHPKRAPVRAR